MNVSTDTNTQESTQSLPKTYKSVCPFEFCQAVNTIKESDLGRFIVCEGCRYMAIAHLTATGEVELHPGP